jgi:hypothetical protein
LYISLELIKKKPTQPSAAPILVSPGMDISILTELEGKFVDFEIQRAISFNSNDNNIFYETDSQNPKSSSQKLEPLANNSLKPC